MTERKATDIKWPEMHGDMLIQECITALYERTEALYQILCAVRTALKACVENQKRWGQP
jgi:hypothetical protein